MSGIQIIRSQRGMTSKLARGLGITRGAISQWPEVPAERIPDVERITGIPRHELRPDLWEAPAHASADAA